MATVTVNSEYTVRSPTTVTATKATADAFLLHFGNMYGVIEVSFTDASDNPVARELWAIRGAELVSALNRANQGSKALDEIEATLEFIIDYVENTPGRKDNLIASGVLDVQTGEIINGIRPWKNG